MTELTYFSSRLRAEREKSQLTQAQLAQRIGVSTQTISAYEKGGEKGKLPTLDNAAAIAHELGVSLDYLSGLSDSPSAQAVGFKDLSDVFNYLNVLPTYFECSIGKKTVPLPEVEFADLGNGQMDEIRNELVAEITIKDSGLAHFFEKRNQVYQLVKNGTLQAEIYQTWLNAELEGLKKDWPIYPKAGISDFE